MSSGNGSGRSGGRGLKVRVKTAKKRSVSSARWLERQLNDPYVAEAKRLGLRSRAAFKIMELDERFHLFHPGSRVVDLGAAPGGWSQFAAEKVHAENGQGKVVAIDILAMDPLPGVDFLQLDFMADDAPDRLKQVLGGEADIVMSDMAANATGHRQTDHLKIMALCEAGLHFAREVLAPGGAFVAKVLRGGTENALLADMKRDFAVVKHVKPKASRADSAEVYVIATGFRGKA